MIGRKWHVEHKDGSEWAEDDLDAIVNGYRLAQTPDASRSYCDRILMNGWGDLLILDGEGDVWPVLWTEDMVVVRDDAIDHNRADDLVYSLTGVLADLGVVIDIYDSNGDIARMLDNITDNIIGSLRILNKVRNDPDE